MARPKKIIPKENKDPIMTMESYAPTITSVEDEPEDKIHFNKEIVTAIASNKPPYERIKFVNNRDPGRPLDFFYASKTHPLKSYKLLHDKEYDLPIEVINHLEGTNPHDPNSCHTMGYEDKFDERSGMTKSTISSYKSLYQCKSIRGR